MNAKLVYLCLSGPTRAGALVSVEQQLPALGLPAAGFTRGGSKRYPIYQYIYQKTYDIYAKDKHYIQKGCLKNARII